MANAIVFGLIGLRYMGTGASGATALAWVYLGLNDLALPRSAKLHARFDRGFLGGVTVITGMARRRRLPAWRGDLYRPAGSNTKQVRVTAVPYYAWCNRKPGEMLVWIREC